MPLLTRAQNNPSREAGTFVVFRTSGQCRGKLPLGLFDFSTQQVQFPLVAGNGPVRRAILEGQGGQLIEGFPPGADVAVGAQGLVGVVAGQHPANAEQLEGFLVRRPGQSGREGLVPQGIPPSWTYRAAW